MNPNKTVRVNLQNIIHAKNIPHLMQFEQWVQEATSHHRKRSEITIRIVDEKESAALNKMYRHKQGPTNILSFPFSPPPSIRTNLIGDLVICASLIEKESQQQGKLLTAHWAHIVIHGTLHLLGYDHITHEEANIMEGIEIEILNRLGFPDPY